MSQEQQNWNRFIANNVLTRIERMRRGQKHTDDGPKKQSTFGNILGGAFFGEVLGVMPGAIWGVFVLGAHDLDNMVGTLWCGLLAAGGVAASMVWGPFQYKYADTEMAQLTRAVRCYVNSVSGNRKTLITFGPYQMPW